MTEATTVELTYTAALELLMALQAAALCGQVALVAVGGWWLNRRCQARHAQTLARLEQATADHANILRDLHGAIRPQDMHTAAGAIRDAADTLSHLGRPGGRPGTE